MTDGPGTPHRPDRAGWFDDPDNSEQLRYFDGILWTDHVTPRRTVWHPSPASTTEASPATGVAGTDAPRTPSPPAGSPPGGPFGYPPAQGGWGQQPPPTPGRPPGGAYGAPAAHGAGAPTTADGVPLASMGSRLGAWALDSLITWTLGLVLGGYLLWRGLGNYPDIVADMMRTGVAPADPAALAERIRFDLPWLGAFAVLQMLVGVGYHTFFLSRMGATPGKQVVGISVRRTERPGVLSSADALRRSMFRPMLFLFTYTPMLGLLAMPFSVIDAVVGLWDPKRQTLHDKLGGTVVVQGRQPRDRMSAQ